MGCVYIHGEMEGKRDYSKELSRVIRRLVNPNSAEWARRLGTQGRASVVVQVRRLSAGRIPHLGEVILCPMCPSTDCVRPTHVREGHLAHLLYSASTDFKPPSETHLHV